MRYAIVIVAEASNLDDLWETVTSRLHAGTDPLAPKADPEFRYIGNPSVVPDAEEYATDSLRIVADDAVFTTHPVLLEEAEDGDHYAAQVLRDAGIEIPPPTA